MNSENSNINNPQTQPAEKLPQLNSGAALKWDYDIPLTSSFILSGLLKAFGIPLLFIIALLGWVTMNSGIGIAELIEINKAGFGNAAILIGITIFLVIVLLAVLYKGKYYVQFTVDDCGVTSETRKQQRKLNTIINYLLIFIGIVTGKPGATGTGLIAQSSQSSAVEWQDVYYLTAYAKKRVVVLHNSWRKVMIIYCTEANFETVLNRAKAAIERTKEVRNFEHSENKKYLSSTLTWFVLTLIAFLLLLTSPLIDNKLTIVILGCISLLAVFLRGNVRRYVGYVSFFALLGNVLIMVKASTEVYIFVARILEVSRMSHVLQYEFYSLISSTVGVMGLLFCIRKSLSGHSDEATHGGELITIRSPKVYIVGVIVLVVIVALGMQKS